MSTVPFSMSPVNSDLSLSAQGRADLMRREGVIRHYYNDVVNNCTYGVGSLAHLGPCSPRELQTPLSDTQIVASMQAGVSVAENAIRKNITDRTLTQQQFDALVSFTYNVGAGGAREVLRLVDLGWFNQAAQTMMLSCTQQYMEKTGNNCGINEVRLLCVFFLRS